MHVMFVMLVVATSRMMEMVRGHLALTAAMAGSIAGIAMGITTMTRGIVVHIASRIMSATTLTAPVQIRHIVVVAIVGCV